MSLFYTLMMRQFRFSLGLGLGSIIDGYCSYKTSRFNFDSPFRFVLINLLFGNKIFNLKKIKNWDSRETK